MPYKGSNLKIEMGRLQPSFMVTADYMLTPDKKPMVDTAIAARDQFNKEIKILLV